MDIASMNVRSLLKKSFPQVDADVSLADAIAKMVGVFEQEVLVFDNGKYLGNISPWFILKSRADVSKAKARNSAVVCPKVSLDDSVVSVAQRMLDSNAKVLPVFSGSFFEGTVGASEIIKQMASVEELSNIKVSSLIAYPLTVQENESVDKVIKVMRSKNVERLVVLNKDKVSGMLFFDDLAKKFLLKKTSDSKAYVSGFGKGTLRKNPNIPNVLKSPISNELSAVFPTADVSDSLKKVLVNFNPRTGIVVTSNGVLKGLLTTHTLLKVLASVKVSTRNIQFSNFPVLDEIDKAKADKTIETAYDRIAKLVGQEFTLHIHFKQHQKQGSRINHSIHAKVLSAKHNFQADKAAWNFLTALQETLSALDQEMKKKLRSVSSKQKASGFQKSRRKK
ncbi:MAG: CBS domain-containing protein [Candidatus Diapherotrites archaeon]|nr:CBS domain-containing protein [Candidatus Diapherotrites archaeon]